MQEEKEKRGRRVRFDRIRRIPDPGKKRKPPSGGQSDDKSEIYLWSRAILYLPH